MLMSEVMAYPEEEGEVVLRFVSGGFKGEGGREGG